MKMTRETFERAQELHAEIENLTELTWAIINCVPACHLATIRTEDNKVINTVKLDEATRIKLKHFIDDLLREKIEEFEKL